MNADIVDFCRIEVGIAIVCSKCWSVVQLIGELIKGCLVCRGIVLLLMRWGIGVDLRRIGIDSCVGVDWGVECQVGGCRDA